MKNTVNTKEYQVIVTYDNNDYVQTYFNANNMNEIINHYRGHEIEYYDGSSSGAAYALDIKDIISLYSLRNVISRLSALNNLWLIRFARSVYSVSVIMLTPFPCAFIIQHIEHNVNNSYFFNNLSIQRKEPAHS